MKKVLFATTALIATAGIASADVAITGSAEMGVVGGSGTAPTQFFQDIDVTFTLSGETDGGITFGAAVDLDEISGNSDAADNFAEDGGVAIFISGDFGTLTMGDTDGGFDAGMQEVNIGSPGSIADDETSHAGYLGNSGLDGLYDGQILSYSYTISDFTITGSVEMDDGNAPVGQFSTSPFATPARTAVAGNEAEAIYGIGVSYNGSFGGGSYTVGGGYQATADTHANVVGDQSFSIVGISATVALDSGLSAGLNFSQFDYDGGGAFVDMEATHAAIGVAYTFDAITVHANYGVFDANSTAFVADSEGFGLAAGYDFGGGLTALLGYQSSEVTNLNNVAGGNYLGTAPVLGTTNTFSLGLSMSF